MQTLFGARLATHALSPDAPPAIVMPGREIGYRELAGQVFAVARWLSREGCTPSEVVGIAIADEVAHLTASLALLSLGIPQVCLATTTTLTGRLDVARRLGVQRVVVADPRHALPGLTALVLAPGVSATAGGGEPPAALAADSDAPAVYFTSSGTTGAPKIFALSQRTLAWRAETMVRYERIGAGYRAFSAASIENGAALSKRLNCALLGYTSVFAGGDELALSMPELCRRFDVAALELSVLQAHGLAGAEADAGDLGPHTTAYVSGSRVPAQLRQQFRDRFGTPLFVHYGAREFGRISCTFPDPSEDSVESVGLPLPWVELEIVDDHDRPLPRGEIGQVRARSECMGTGYHQDPEATARHYRGGWYYPGDFGALTATGALCLHGRTDDMMNLNSIKIFPAEIERVLEAHPAVKAAAAFARRSAVHGDIPLAAVELHAAGTVDAGELLRHVRAQLGVRAPRRIIVLDALPRSPAGKILKRDLTDLA
jgi:long-chain acyl-CoA synthetase